MIPDFPAEQNIWDLDMKQFVAESITVNNKLYCSDFDNQLMVVN